MNDLFPGNLAALERRYPRLGKTLRNHEPSVAYQLRPGPEDLWDLIRLDGKAESAAYGVPNPLRDSIAYWRGKHLRNPALMVFMGLDLGYQLSAHLASPNPNTQAYLLIEKDLDIFHHLLHVVDIRPLLGDRRFHFVVGVEEGALFTTLREILRSDTLFTLVHGTTFETRSFSYSLYGDYYRACTVALRDAVRDLQQFSGNSPLDTFIGIRHMLLNLDTIAREPGVTPLFDRFRGRPAVIVATGPSLDKNYRLLAEIQDRAVILSVDASMKFLLRNGIRPQLVTCLERVPETLPFFQDLDPLECRETTLVTVPVVVPEVYSTYPGPKAVMYRPLLHFEWLQHDKGTLYTGHSSANMAFKLAVAMGCDPILLVGQDLAYADDGDTHASAAYWGKTATHLDPAKMDTLRVKGNTQEWVLTNNIWHLFLTAYKRDVSEFAGTVVNATEGGAYIEGTVVETLRQAIDTRVGEAFSPAEAIRAELAKPGADEAEAFLQRVRSELIPATTDCINRAVTEFRRTVRKIRRVLDRDTTGREVASVLQEAHSVWLDRTLRDPLFHRGAFQVIQSAFVQTRLAYHDLPNRIDNVTAIHRARLQLLARCMADYIAILERLVSLYNDPEGTVPPSTKPG